MKWVILLRGINVSGSIVIRMAELRSALEEDGFQAVKTHVQSGNIVLESECVEPDPVARRVRSCLANHWGHEVETLVMSPERFADCTKHPVLDSEKGDPKFAHVTFLFQKPSQVPPESEFPLGQGERLEYRDSFLFLYCPNGYGRTKIHNNFLEKKFGVSATTRNWKTIQALQNLLSASY